MLKTYQRIRQEAPDLSAGQVLEQVNPVDRGAVLQALLRASAKNATSADLWAASGEALVRIEIRPVGDGGAGGPNGIAPRTEIVSLPDSLGPLRSVRPAVVGGKRALLVGARFGLIVFWPGGANPPEYYRDPVAAGMQSQLGFNSAIHLPDTNEFVAAHGDAGIVRWAAGRYDAPVAAIRCERFGSTAVASKPVPQPSLIAAQSAAATMATFATPSGAAARPPGPRNLVALAEGQVCFSIGERFGLVDPENAGDFRLLRTDGAAEILALIPDGRRIAAVHEDGSICSISRSTWDSACVQAPGARLRSAGALPWLGGTRLLLAADEGAVQCLGVDDPLITQYNSPHRGLRTIAGSTEWVIAVASDRGRLIVWNSWDGHRPAGEVHISGLTRHRVADIAFG